jgi:dihydrodiol dehydrogenase / D-xylose 1-dehydrogenase (NADP)
MKWGVISTGAICNDFTLALKKTPKAVLHAVASRSQESADEFAQKHGFAKAYPSYEALVADPEVEIVYVATPHSFHCANILMCLEAGKHVLSEKPMVVNAKQAEQCIAKAKEKGLFLMEGMWTRFFPTARAIKAAVQSGAIGKVVSMTASLGFKAEPHFNQRLFQPELAGGALFDVGIYPAMWISAFLGTPSKVTAHAKMQSTGVDSQTFATFEYADGAMAHLECSFEGSLVNEVVIVGETGYIKTSRPTQCPEGFTIVTRQGDEPDPMLLRGKAVTTHQVCVCLRG